MTKEMKKAGPKETPTIDSEYQSRLRKLQQMASVAGPDSPIYSGGLITSSICGLRAPSTGISEGDMDALGAIIPAKLLGPTSIPTEPEPLMKGASDLYEQMALEALGQQRSELEGSTTPSKRVIFNPATE